MTLSISTITLNNVADSGAADRQVWAVALLVTVLTAVLQLYHGVPRASTPAAWRWTVPAQILIAVAAAVYVGQGMLGALVGLAVSNTLLWLPPRWSVPIVVVAAVGEGAAPAALPRGRRLRALPDRVVARHGASACTPSTACPRRPRACALCAARSRRTP
ncbi:hypothetical protein [Nonomuraea dietziae]|uniref:hypothetical protein n=1 Tax=Nonomuraea dietziae TaxID=65515 RepID=UPI0031D3E2DA